MNTHVPTGSASPYANLPLNFEQNIGQTNSKVQFISRGPGYTLFITPTEAVFSLHAGNHPLRNEKRLGKRNILEQALKASRRRSVVRMKLTGANPNLQATGLDRLPGVTNYFIGHDKTSWRSGVPLYSKVQYSGVFPGVDLVYYGNQRQLEYDFVVNPGASPRTISFGFDGPKSVSTDNSGNLALNTDIGALKLNKPVIYQMVGGKRKEIRGNYSLRGSNTVGIDVTDYDKSQPLIIDPVLVYSTYLGGSDDDGIYDLAVDSQGDTYVVGWTDSPDFPIRGNSITSSPNGTDVAFVSELNASGTALVYSTYLGGTGGDFGSGIALDGNGYVYVTGDTSSADFPVTSNAYQASLGWGASGNAFVSKLSADGQSLLYSTYLGGGMWDGGYSIAVDANQNAFVDGLAMSGAPSPFPTTSNAFQTTLNSPNGNGFVARINTTKSGASSLVYSTFLGGSISIANDWDQACGIAVDWNDNVYVTGMASSSDFPVTSPTAYQTTVNPNGNAFLTQIDTTQSGSASLIYSTILGGTGQTDQGSSVTLDQNGYVYITGGIGSSNFPHTTSLSGSDFVAKFDTTQSGSSSLLYSTFVGGTSDAFTYNVQVDPNGNAYVSGWTWSSNLPVTSDAIQSSLGSSGQNSFVTALSPDGSTILFGTYLGGDGGVDDFAPGLALDQNYDIYVAGATQSKNFQTTPGVFQPSLQGNSNAFVARLTPLEVPVMSSISPDSGLSGSTVTISGEYFGANQGTSSVFFSGVAATVQSWSSDLIVVQVPSGAPTSLCRN